MELNYLNHLDFKIEPKDFTAYLKRLESKIELMEGVLNVVFVTDPYIQALNKAYRAKNKPTDVLSFNYQDQGSDLLGEVYISVDTAAKQAVEHGHGLVEELIKLLIHGILHVHGFDHEEDEDYKVMYALEKAVLGPIAGPFIENE